MPKIAEGSKNHVLPPLHSLTFKTQSKGISWLGHIKEPMSQRTPRCFNRNKNKTTLNQWDALCYDCKFTGYGFQYIYIPGIKQEQAIVVVGKVRCKNCADFNFSKTYFLSVVASTSRKWVRLIFFVNRALYRQRKSDFQPLV